MRSYEEQNEDLKTNRIRDDIKISLTDKQYNSIKLMAYKAGLESAEELITSFIDDLTYWHSNGSDERDIAEQWYERTYSMDMETRYFRHFLFSNNYELEELQEMLENTDFFESIYQAFKDESTENYIESKDVCLKLLKSIVDTGKEL